MGATVTEEAEWEEVWEEWTRQSCSKCLVGEWAEEAVEAGVDFTLAKHDLFVCIYKDSHFPFEEHFICRYYDSDLFTSCKAATS